MYIDINVIVAFLLFAALETTIIMVMLNGWLDNRHKRKMAKKFDKHYETIVR